MTSARLEEAYEAAVVQLGGIYSARPRDIHQALAAEFPELTVQVRYSHSVHRVCRVLCRVQGVCARYAHARERVCVREGLWLLPARPDLPHLPGLGLSLLPLPPLPLQSVKW